MNVLYLPLGKGMFAMVDSDCPEFILKQNWWAVQNGHDTYVQCRVKGKRLHLHREVMAAPESRKVEVDHINGDPHDNRRANLRLCSRAENCYNSSKSSGTSSKFKGVSWDRKRKKWLVGIGFNGKRRNLGRFNLEVDAARAYDVAAKESFGRFAKLNFPV